MRLAIRHSSASALLVAVLAPLVCGCPSTPYQQVELELGPSAPTAAGASTATTGKLRFSVAAMQSPQGTRAGYSRLLEVLARRMGEEIEFVQRRTYAEVNDMLASDKLDAAIVCTGGYLDLERRFPGSVEVVAVPVVQGATTYRSYIIVPTDSGYRSLADLRGKRFAYTDELSLSGYRYIVHLLRKERQDPRSYFAGASFTQSHDRSIEAVAKGVVDGASVDSLVFDQLARQRPWISGAVRVIDRSPSFGSAPVIVSKRLSQERREKMRTVLLGLQSDPEGAPALGQVGFERFVAPEPHMFDSAAAVMGSTR